MQSQLKQHLAIATGAVSVAAVPVGADAAIVYKDDTNAFTVSVAGTTSAEWDIDGDGGNDFLLTTFASIYVSFNSATGRNGRGLLATGTNEFNRLALGLTVEPILSAPYTWAGSGDRPYIEITSYGSIAGRFGNGVIGSNFIGFRFLSGTDLLYGWGEINVQPFSVTVNRWAYNDEADGSIEVGDTGQQVPAPSTLALLAAGAFGLRRWRGRRAAA
ncbi:MAG: hypothetical protein N838_33930 [Thiohalocapsa sp. PB-PSB1]|nr:MAG: hypothetical protein N838_33930 [Thiohalocapsa sp. PB-PSB1]